MFRSTRCTLALLALLVAPLAACGTSDPTAPDAVVARQGSTQLARSATDTSTATTVGRIAQGSRNLCDATQPWWLC
ncbi:hypothetical protein J421_4997 (plasmid) [Gemmatirosa kalamazoonensis]|uniref:Lipoprotein n=1 Tax=Gemmatirosa kalamazoonensis TaxID=861299 RepID=W0RPW6_9BACT|nr:hypothetical protein [Gemmatirosa kalamazoonensis]AHG92532.1 hypothetical protein J421_4997 [Gemmatirosa kalamazoonensis]